MYRKFFLLTFIEIKFLVDENESSHERKSSTMLLIVFHEFLNWQNAQLEFKTDSTQTPIIFNNSKILPINIQITTWSNFSSATFFIWASVHV